MAGWGCGGISAPASYRKSPFLRKFDTHRADVSVPIPDCAGDHEGFVMHSGEIEFGVNIAAETKMTAAFGPGHVDITASLLLRWKCHFAMPCLGGICPRWPSPCSLNTASVYLFQRLRGISSGTHGRDDNHQVRGLLGFFISAPGTGSILVEAIMARAPASPLRPSSDFFGHTIPDRPPQ